MDATPKILIIDDDDLVTMGIKMAVKNSYLKESFLYIYDPAKALNYLENESCDLIVLDYKMPELTGPDVLDELLKRGQVDVPVIAYSSMDCYNEEMQEYPNVICSFEKKHNQLISYLERRFKDYPDVPADEGFRERVRPDAIEAFLNRNNEEHAHIVEETPEKQSWLPLFVTRIAERIGLSGH